MCVCSANIRRPDNSLGWYEQNKCTAIIAKHKAVIKAALNKSRRYKSDAICNEISVLMSDS